MNIKIQLVVVRFKFQYDNNYSNGHIRYVLKYDRKSTWVAIRRVRAKYLPLLTSSRAVTEDFHCFYSSLCAFKFTLTNRNPTD